MLALKHTPVRLEEKFGKFCKRRQPQGVRLPLDAAGLRREEFLFNPSDIFAEDGQRLMAARRGTAEETGDCTVLLRESGGVWRIDAAARQFPLQDPNIAHIGDELVLSGVRCRKDGKGEWHWHCEFYRGKRYGELEYFFSGPPQMKDIRLVELPDGKVGVFTRPQGLAYRAKTGHIADIGYTEVESLSALSAEKIANAPLLEGVFMTEEWGGVNMVYPLRSGLLGVLGHVARGDGPFREGLTVHYYAMTFVFDPKSREFTPPELLAARGNFACVPEQKLRGDDVLFPAGLERRGGRAVLRCGVADRVIGELETEDPFLRYE